MEGAWTATGISSSASAGPSLAKGGIRVAATVARETVAVGDTAAAAAAADTAVKRGRVLVCDLALAAALSMVLSTWILILSHEKNWIFPKGNGSSSLYPSMFSLKHPKRQLC